jgi:hypothetical protein
MRAWQIRWIAVCALSVFLMPAHADERADANLLVQVAFVTGLQHYEGNKVFERLEVGDALRLVRERRNSADPNAIRVEWSGHVLGYVPGNVNVSLARQMDFGNRLRARVLRLSRHRDPDRRIEMEIYLPL